MADLARPQREPAAIQGRHWIAVARNEQARYKSYWAMVIAEKPSKKKESMVAAERKTANRQESAENSDNTISAIKNFICKYLF